MKKILLVVLLALVLSYNFVYLFNLPLSSAVSGEYKVFIYYDEAYPACWIQENEAYFFREFLSRVFSNYSIPFEVVDAKGLADVCLNVSGADKNIIIMTKDVAPDTIWDGSADGSLIESWLEAGGIMIWTGTWEFFYIGHNDTTKERIEGMEDYVFDQTVTTSGLMFTFPTNESLSILPGFDRLYTCCPSTKNLISNLYHETWGSYKIGDVEYLDPVLFQAGSDAQGYFIKVGMATDCTVLYGKLIAEIILNRFFNLNVEVPPKRVEVYSPATTSHFTLDMIVPGYLEDPDLTPYQSGPPARLNWSRIIASNLNNLGIEVKLHFVDWPHETGTSLIPPSGHMQPLGGTYEEGGFDAFFIGWATLPQEDITIWNVTEYLRTFFHSQNIPPDSSQEKYNYVFWNNSLADYLLDQAIATSNETEAENHIKEWQNVFHQEQPVAIILHVDHYIINGTYYLGHQELGFNMRHPILGSGVETPKGKINASKAAESAKCIRQAISHTIPRQALIETLNLQNSTQGITPVDPFMPGFNTELQPYEYNLTKAIELMAEAGYTTTMPVINVNDDFNDNTIDTMKWIVFSSPTGHLYEKNRELQLELTNETLAEKYEVGADSTWIIGRDFDVQVDYRLIEWPEKNGMFIGLQAGPPTSRGAPDIIERKSDYASYDECYLTHFSDGVYGVTPTNHTSGKLRIVRLGSIVTGYYFNGTNWVQLHSAPTEVGYGHVRLVMCGGPTCPRGVAAFDNFIVNFGHIINAISGEEIYAPSNVSEFFTIHVLLPTWNPLRVEWAREVAQSLTEIGIRVRLLFSPIKNFVFSRMENRSLYDNGGYDACFIGLAYGLSMENMTEIVYGFLRELYYSSSSSNYYNWNNSESDELLDGAATCNDTVLIEQYLKQWQKLYYEEQPSPILFYFLSDYPLHQELMLNMLHPVFGTGLETPLGIANSSRAAEAAKYVRQAISYAIPRQLIAEKLNLTTNPEYIGLGITPYHPLWHGFDSSLQPYEYNLTKAKELLAKAGYGVTITAACPVNLWVTDPYGRHVGTNPETGEAVIEIPGATYSGPNTEPQVIWIPHPEESYEITVVGRASGTYTLTVTKITEETFASTISEGATHHYITTLTANQSQTSPAYSLTISATTGGTTNPAPGTYTHPENSTVQITAIPEVGYQFDYWELDSVNVGSANPYTVLMDKDHTLRAVFSAVAPPISVSISPLSGSIIVGQSITFTSSVSGGYTPYTLQWYLDDAPVLGANQSNWNFTPTTSGIFYVYLKVTDAKGSTAQSAIARIAVASVPVGGYSIPLIVDAEAFPIKPSIILLTILIVVSTMKCKKARRVLSI